MEAWASRAMMPSIMVVRPQGPAALHSASELTWPRTQGSLAARQALGPGLCTAMLGMSGSCCKWQETGQLLPGLGLHALALCRGGTSCAACAALPQPAAPDCTCFLSEQVVDAEPVRAPMLHT